MIYKIRQNKITGTYYVYHKGKSAVQLQKVLSTQAVKFLRDAIVVDNGYYKCFYPGAK